MSAGEEMVREQLDRNHVYVAPPNVDLRIENDTFKVVSPRTRNKEQGGRYLFEVVSRGYGGACGRHCPLWV